MGRTGSSRWRDHEKAPLVEQAICLDLVALRRGGLLDRPGTGYSLSWTRGSSDTPAADGLLSLEIDPSGARRLNVVIKKCEGGNLVSARLDLEPFHPHLGGVRWFFRCQACDRRVLKLYVAPSGSQLACRQCHGLTYRSVQEHDARLDQARRDPEGFAEARQAVPMTPNSAWVTLQIYWDSLEARRAPRRGRSWGRDSMTEIKRILAAGEVG